MQVHPRLGTGPGGSRRAGGLGADGFGGGLGDRLPGRVTPRPPPAPSSAARQAALRNYPPWVPRPPTPEWLKRFVIELYGGRCLRCGVDRPLEVAHLAPWPVVRDDAMRQPGPNQEGMAILRFHQPENLVLLCANCHTLLDNPAVAEVDQGLMFYLRDRALRRGHTGIRLQGDDRKQATAPGQRRRASTSVRLVAEGRRARRTSGAATIHRAVGERVLRGRSCV